MVAETAGLAFAFPRGGGGSGGTSGSKNLQEDNDDDNNKNKKKERRLRPSEITKKRKAEQEGKPIGETDFLFGKTSTSGAEQSPSSSNKKSKTASSASSSSSLGRHSLLPIGGGGVVRLPNKQHKDLLDGPKSKTAGGNSIVIEALSFQKLSKGTKLLACVREVHDEFCIVSLPNMLTGYMLLPPTTASTTTTPSVSSLHQCVQVGQLLTVAVLKAASESVSKYSTDGPKKRIQVSALPTHVNPKEDTVSTSLKSNTNTNTATTTIRGQILSVEDHGCLVDLGMGRQGFLKFDQVEGGKSNNTHRSRKKNTNKEEEGHNNYVILEAEERLSEDATSLPSWDQRVLQPGRLYDFMIATPTSSKVSTSVLPLKLPKTATIASNLVTPPVTASNRNRSTPTAALTLPSLQPGMMVTAKIEAVAKNGLCVTFLNNVFRGAIELGGHLGGYFGLSSSTDNHHQNQVKRTDLETVWRKVFDQHQHFPARIIAIDVPSKMIRLSIAPHILSMKAPIGRSLASNIHKRQPQQHVQSSSTNDSLVVGTILDNCTVVRVDAGIGALLALPQDYEVDIQHRQLPKKISSKSDLFQNDAFEKAMQVPAVYVHISKAYDDVYNQNNSKKDKKQKSKVSSSSRDLHSGSFAKDFSLGSKHKVRILNTGHWIDDVAAGGCAPSILEAHVLTHDDLKPGQLYKQVPVCVTLNGGSVLVNLGGSPGNPVRGLISSPLHLIDKPATASSDYRKKVLETKFAVDAKVDVRVLWVDHANKKCLLTAKKSLVKVKDESEIITSYEDLQVGQKAIGFVSKVDDRALYVTFCNRIYGKITAKSLASELGIESHRDNYKVGDVLTCRVAKISKKIGRGRRSSINDDDDHHDDDLQEDVDDMDTESTPKQKAFYQLLLSLNVDKDDDAMDAEDDDDAEQEQQTIKAKENVKASSGPQQIRIKPGAILPEKTMKIVELFKGKYRGKTFIPGYAIVSIKSKYLLADAKLSKSLPQIECKLPFDQLLDDYESKDIASPEALDALAARTLRLGKKINQQAIILTDPRKTNVDHSSGVGKLAVVSLRKSLITSMENEASSNNDENSIFVPSPESDFYVGALVKGYIAQIDQRHGAFLRFLDGMTGLIPRMNGGLDLKLYSTLVAKVQVIDDTVRPYRIMLQPVAGIVKKSQEDLPFKVGDKIEKAQVKEIHFMHAILEVKGSQSKNVKVILHASMKNSSEAKIRFMKKRPRHHEIVKGHPFFGLENDHVFNNDLTVVGVSRRKGTILVHVTDRPYLDSNSAKDVAEAPTFVEKQSQLKSGMTVSAVVIAINGNNKGLSVLVSPFLQGFIPGLELSEDLEVLNNMAAYVSVGAMLKCVVMDGTQWFDNRANTPFASRLHQNPSKQKNKKQDLFLSVLAVKEPTLSIEKPARNDLVIGHINMKLPQHQAPSLMLSLRGGFVGRCCITELAECDDWENMPLGHGNTKQTEPNGQDMLVDGRNGDDDESSDAAPKTDRQKAASSINDTYPFSEKSYFQCRVLKSLPKQSLVEVSLRSSRLEGDLDDDEVPPVGETVQGFVVETNKKGCFVRLSRQIEGRATLTELCDGFLPNPSASFPAGRLVVGQVKAIKPMSKKSKSSKIQTKFTVDLDMRESTLLENNSKKMLSFEDVEVNAKYKGTVTRIESYGVFVQLENSKISGLAHMSECSDNFIKNLSSLYDPGDLVKVLVLKKDEDEKKIGFSLKPSHFKDDPDSESDSDDDSESMMDEDMEQQVDSDDDSSLNDDKMKVDEDNDSDEEDDLDSDDENFATKLAAKMHANGDVNSDSDDDSDENEDASASSEDEATPGLDTNVGFDWEFKGDNSKVGMKKKDANDGNSSDSSDSDSEDDDEDADDTGKGGSHKSRKRQAARRREEQEISKREIALADGTADENPETAGDFERLLAGNPNSSELWIRYMAFHLSLADISAARMVAEKAIDRIEFREEREKLNVWTALLTLEHKYGTDESLKKTIERACGQNNPKQIYLRTCEILEKDLATTDQVLKADAMYKKMCSKFKSKKTVWLAHLTYLLKQSSPSRNEEAHALLKRALLSLPSYKHAETMSRFAQLEFEFGSPERARTLFDGIISRYPKRLDLFYVYVDKEVKFGSFSSARTLLEQKVNGGKLSDKQVKGLFKKWFRLEEEHGTEESMEHVKDSARKYVQKTSSSSNNDE